MICLAAIIWPGKMSAQLHLSCLTLCDAMDCSSSVHGILQARIQEWVAISFSRDLPDPGIELGSPAWQADFFLSAELPGNPLIYSR